MSRLKPKTTPPALPKSPKLPERTAPKAAATPTAIVPDGALMTPRDVAARLRVTEKALENWRGSGAGPAFVRLGHRCVRYRAEDVDAFVAGRVRQNTGQV